MFCVCVFVYVYGYIQVDIDSSVKDTFQDIKFNAWQTTWKSTLNLSMYMMLSDIT